ncbi:MAG TPA: GNAT family N-acetyltransferase, partial [Candidatus Kapabacteria bacterium]|nr:GNAT family N-acetyltransferase [Candidatus Kapabacteria bacterium]
EITESSVADSAEIARILRTTMDHDLPYLPKLHTPEEDVEFIRNNVFTECTVIVSKEDDTIAGFCAYKDGWVNHLYILPKYQGQGRGSALLKMAMDANRELQLWTFQKNARARKFYEAHGFSVVELTNGEGNEEKEPDLRYVWKRN